MTDWKTIDSAPKDGRRILVGEVYKWLEYKPGAPKSLQGKGRWMVRNEHGGWERAHNQPSHWLCEAPKETADETQ